MKKILLQHFPSLNNYGTAMMGLTATQFFHDHFGGDVEIYSEISSDKIIAEVKSELRCPVEVKYYHHPYQKQFDRSSGTIKNSGKSDLSMFIESLIWLLFSAEMIFPSITPGMVRVQNRSCSV
ncbi:MAG: hypothetical protein LBH00_05815 [Planctomycetaceae bacterium]|jgi:hypothetical protein|nr:hypothetical protein [Planctomycetaceae bacterium]